MTQEHVVQFLVTHKYPVVRRKVDCCAWGHYYMKPTHHCTDKHGALETEGDVGSGGGHRHVQGKVSIREHWGEGEVGSRSQDKAEKSPDGGHGGAGQEVKQLEGSAPPGAAQGTLQGQAGQVQEEEGVTVP